ncbi:MAG TPA: tetratricopeptide repeat protein [Polyangiaceae bacterium]
MRVVLGELAMAAAATILLGCGGSAPPAETGGTPPVATTPPPAETSALPPGPEPAPSAELMAGIKAFDAGSFADARRSFEAASKKDPKNYEALFDLGQTCEKLGDKPAAEAAYKGALDVRADLDTAATALSSMYIEANRLDEAVAVAKAGLGKRPGSVGLHENLGVALAMHGDQDGATQELQAAVKAQPNEPMYHLTLAHWLSTWRVPGAKAHLDAARDLVKDDYGLLVEVGFEYRMAGEFDSCVKLLDRTVGMKDGGEVRTDRALCKLGLKDEKGAFEDLQAAVTKEPSYATAHYYLAGRLAAAKRYKEAADEYASYLKLAPNGSLAKAATERLKLAQDAAKGKKH